MGSSTLAGVQLTIPQAIAYAKEAGFQGKPLAIIVAIAQAESGLYTHAVNAGDPYTGSFGVLQLNGSHFGDKFGPNGEYTMSQAAAFDPELSFLFGWELSNYGQDFSPWSTFTNGAYLQYLSGTQDAIKTGGGSGPQDVTFPPYTGTPWYNFNVYSDYGYQGSTYRNTDVGTPVDTPLTAPLAGTITDLGYFDWGGQITVKVDQPSLINGHKDYFLIHLDAINPNLQVGQHIEQGTFLGYSGGQLSNAGLASLPAGLSHHVTLPSHSTGPHLDIGVTDSGTGSMDVDQSASDALVALAQTGAIPFSTEISGSSLVTLDTSGSGQAQNGGKQFTQKIHQTLVQHPGFYGIAAAIDQAENFPGFVNDMPVIDSLSLNDFTKLAEVPGGFLQSIADTIVGNSIPVAVRGILITVGLFLVLALVYQLAKPNLEALPSLIGLAAL